MKLIELPSGFATLLGAIATVLTGLLVFAGAIMAWRSVQRQIRAAENIEKKRHSQEIAALEAGFKEARAVQSPIVTPQDIAVRLQTMAASLAQALDGLNDCRKFSIPPGIEVPMLNDPYGSVGVVSVPDNSQDLLSRLAGPAVEHLPRPYSATT